MCYYQKKIKALKSKNKAYLRKRLSIVDFFLAFLLTADET
jgi:hypothetical protein